MANPIIEAATKCAREDPGALFKPCIAMGGRNAAGLLMALGNRTIQIRVREAEQALRTQSNALQA